MADISVSAPKKPYRSISNVYISKYKFVFYQMILKIVAGLLKNAPVLLNHLQSFWQLELYIQVFKVTWTGSKSRYVQT